MRLGSGAGAGEVDEAVADAGAFVGHGVGEVGYLPHGGVDGGEECVGVVGVGRVDYGEAEAVGYVERFGIDLPSADDEHFAVGGAHFESFGERVCGLDAGGGEAGVAGDHHVAAVGECSFGERLECAASHHHGVSCGEFLEVAEVAGEVVEEVAVAADGAFA